MNCFGLSIRSSSLSSHEATKFSGKYPSKDFKLTVSKYRQVFNIVESGLQVAMDWKSCENNEIETIATTVIDTAFHIHEGLGPGLLESVYQKVLSQSLRRKGLKILTEVPVKYEYDGMKFEDDLRVDILVNDCLVIELKSVEKIQKVHSKQLLTYLRLLGLPLGLLINFGDAYFKQNCIRVLNEAFKKEE